MLNKSIYCQELFNVKHTITIVNGTVDSTNTVQPVFLLTNIVIPDIFPNSPSTTP